MGTLRRHLIVTAAAALAAAAAPAAELFPSASARLEATRYIPAEDQLHWQGWIGGGASLVRARGVTLWGRAEVETILGHVIRPFEATEVEYNLSLGLHATLGRFAVVPFFQHVSRHYADRAKTEAVDWNHLGLEVSGRPWNAPVWLLASFGHVQSSLPGYEWEARAAAEATAWSGSKAAVLLRGELRFVVVRENDTPKRGDFADWTLEGALRWEAAGRALETYVSAEKRNDVFLETPGARQRALLGLRVLYNRPRPHLQLGP
jgi:hypothetical protein